MPLSGQEYRQHLLAQNKTEMFTDPVRARAQCLSLLDEARRVFDTSAFIDAALQLSLIEDQLGDLNSAISHLSEAIVFAEEFKKTQYIPELLEQIGRCYYTQACYPQALEHWQQCVTLCKNQPEFLKTRSLALMGLGQICDAGRDNRLAVQMHAAAHQLLADAGDAYLLVKAKINWAVNLQKLADSVAAKALLREALILCLQHHFPHYAATCCYRLAEIELADGHLVAAESLIEEGLSIVASTPYHWAEVNLLGLWAQLIAKDVTQFGRALDVVGRALTIANEDGFRHLELRLLEQAEHYARESGSAELADEYARRANFIQLDLYSAMSPQMIPNVAGLSALLL
ncbi:MULTISPECIES: hypothetical protein [Deefgea]|uniref:Tetratricopeptide repeat protein n=1 Tax=Deefgea chitinilytica TaxID=570276 RepID=A0ABS2CCH6_9NEIS|nr:MULTISPECIES: hypothetical protein [Deefgea]MBM5571747.1 hypothetical protein [Deefgea chitinilytica]MBM9888982.1 hypothetical protein [Deefgea sp. CFH1-16]